MLNLRSLSFALLIPALLSLYGCQDDKSEATAGQTSTASPNAMAIDDTSGPINEPIDSSLYQGMPLEVALIAEGTYDDGTVLAVTFSAPLDPKRDFQSFLRVNRLIKNSSDQASEAEHVAEVISGQWILAPDARHAYFTQIDPDTRYRVTVQPGLVGLTGVSLMQPHTADIDIGSIAPSVSFASSGHFLPLGLHSGLPIYALNVAEANVSFFRVEPGKEKAMMNWIGNSVSRPYYWMDTIPTFASLVHEGRFTLTTERNKRRQMNLPIQDVAALQQAGVYVAVMSRPGQYDSQFAITYFMVTDLGVHVRQYKNSFDIYISDLNSPSPIAGADVRIYNDNGSVAFDASSSASGVVNVAQLPKHGQLLVVTKGDATSILPLSTAALDLSEFHLSSRDYREEELFIYTPRDIYRGGDEVVLSALLRNDDGKPLAARPLQASLFRPDGQKIKTFAWQPSAPGYYEWRYALGDDAQTGNWRLTVEGASAAQSFQFKVEDFMPERLKITYNEGKPAKLLAKSDDMSVTVLGEYLYGAPASGNKFSAAIRIRPEPHPFAELADFSFGNAGTDTDRINFDYDDKELNKDGKLDLVVASRWQNTATPLKVTLTGSLFESGGRPVVRRYSANVIPADTMIGVRPLFKDRAKARTLAQFELIRTNQAQEKLAAAELTVRLINRTHRYHWRFSSSDGWYMDDTAQEFTELTLTSAITAGETTNIEFPVDWGDYRIEVSDPDSNILTSYEFSAGENWYRRWSQASDAEQGAAPDQVVLALDRSGYSAGDVAKLRIVPPAAGHTLVMVESDHLLWMRRVESPADGTTVDIPISADWARHDLHITALHLQSADEQERITPTRSVGIIHLPLDRSTRELSVTLPEDASWLPNTEVSVAVDVADKQGQPIQQAWVTLAAVDVGILSITDFKTPDPFKYFFEPRAYRVDMFDMYSRLISLNNNPLARQRFGGDAPALSRGGDKARAEVQIVSLFSGLVTVTDGKANISFTLPDFNGRVRLMAIAFDDTRFGMAEQEVTIAAPVVTQLSMPRFLAMGDLSQVALDVSNLSGKDQTFKLQLSSSGAAVGNSIQRDLVLSDGARTTIILPVEGSYPAGAIDIAMQLTDESGEVLQRHWQLNTRAANPAKTEQYNRLLNAGESYHLSPTAMGNWLPETLGVSVSINNQINLNPKNQLRELFHYPYGCLEQSISSTYPWLYISEKKAAKIIQPLPQGQREKSLIEGLRRVVTRQKVNGGYGLWSSNDTYEQHWLTAYAGDFLTDAIDQGVDVPKDVMQQTLNRLKEYVRGRGTMQERWSGRPDLYRPTYTAYAAYVLSRHKRAPLADIRRLAQERPKDLSSLPLLHLALAADAQGDKALAAELLTAMKNAPRESNFYLGDYGSDIRDDAKIVTLLLTHNIEQSYAMTLAASLAESVRKHRYLSTQERNALFMAALQLAQTKGESWQARLELAGVQRTLQQVGEFAEVHYGPELSDGLAIVNSGDKPILAVVQTQGISNTPPKPEANGSTLERRYFSLAGEPIFPVDGALNMKVGDMMLVQVELTAQERHPDMLLVDLLPAGLELENQNLASSKKLDELSLQGKPLSEWQNAKIVHEEFRDDRYVAAVDLNHYRTNRLYYLVRAVTPGHYQVPAPLLEDMYNPSIRAIGKTPDILNIEP